MEKLILQDLKGGKHAMDSMHGREPYFGETGSSVPWHAELAIFVNDPFKSQP